MTPMAMRYWPRKPRFPIIVDTGRGLIGALSGAECSRRIARLGPFESDESMPVVDSTAEGFGFYPKLMVISPLTVKKRWTKAEVVALYNDRKKPNAPAYQPGSLSNRGFDRVVHEVVQLLREPYPRDRQQLSFTSRDAPIAVPSALEALARVRSAAPWDEASICPAQKDFPRVHITWHDSEGFIVHCFENEQSLGQFLVKSRDFSPPTIAINLGGQALERWPRELFISEALAAESLEHFLDYGKRKPSLCWTGTGKFPRETIWESREERETWERTQRGERDV